MDSLGARRQKCLSLEGREGKIVESSEVEREKWLDLCR